jgi:hypothetical protein
MSKSKSLSFKHFDFAKIKVKAPTSKKAKEGATYNSADLPRIIVEGPTVRMPGPDYKENKFNNKKLDYISLVYYDKENEEHNAFIEFREKLHQAFAQQLIPHYAAFGVNKAIKDQTDAWVTGVRVRYPQDKDTKEPDTENGRPYDVYKCSPYTTFIGLDKKPIKHSDLKGMDVVGIPCFIYKSVYVGQGKAAIQWALESFIVEDITESQRSSEQMGHLNELAQDKAKVEAFLAKKTAMLAKNNLANPCEDQNTNGDKKEDEKKNSSKDASKDGSKDASKTVANKVENAGGDDAGDDVNAFLTAATNKSKAKKPKTTNQTS